MAIIRKPMQSTQFTQVPNHWTRDRRLSIAGLGLLTYITSHAANYRLTVRQMLAEHPSGITRLRSAIHEVEKLGYLVRHQQREGGRFGAYDWEIIEFPQVSTGDRFSDDGKTDDGSSADGESTPKNTTTENTKVENSKESGPVLSCADSASGAASDFEDVHLFHVGDDEPADDDSDTSERLDWRTEDRATFRQLLGGSTLTNEGNATWRPATASVDAYYNAFRRNPKRRWKWPGKVLKKVQEDCPAGNLDDWLTNEGFTVSGDVASPA